MQMQQKKIKGFSLLELMVVILIIGTVSTLGFTPFQKWRSDRMVRAGAVKVSSIIQDIYSQVQRGHYSFAQFRIHPVTDDGKKTWFISSSLVTSQGKQALEPHSCAKSSTFCLNLSF